jgi:secondary thiamine-phosphate synthase enzyme
MQKTITFKTTQYNELVDITEELSAFVRASGVQTGTVNVFAQGATAAVMIQENWDDSVQRDVISFLKKQIPAGIWEHDKQDGNADAHIKSGLVGPSETIPIIDGKPALSTWQNVFFCEFDGPWRERSVVFTICQNS